MTSVRSLDNLGGCTADDRAGFSAGGGKCREYANGLMIGGKPEADKMFRRKSFRISKCTVREI